jgi:ABC-type multidrug transport system fused ATPase/permease subunit
MWAAAAYAVKLVIRLKPRLVLVSYLEEIVSRTIPFVEAFLAARIISLLTQLGDAASRSVTYRQLLITLGALLLVRLIQIVETSRYQMFQSQQELELDALIKKQLIAKYTNLPYASYEDKQIIDLYNLAERYCYRMGSFVTYNLRTMAGSIYTLILATVAITHVSVLLACIIALATLPQVILEMKVNREQRDRWRSSTSARRLAYAYEWLFDPSMIKDSRMFGLVTYALEKALHYGKSDQQE